MRFPTRAWCVAEVATAHKMGMRQSLKIWSLQVLDEHEAELRQLRIETMEATRSEDTFEILRKIPNHVAFNARLQVLLFDDLHPLDFILQKWGGSRVTLSFLALAF